MAMDFRLTSYVHVQYLLYKTVSASTYSPNAYLQAQNYPEHLIKRVGIIYALAVFKSKEDNVL